MVLRDRAEVERVWGEEVGWVEEEVGRKREEWGEDEVREDQ